MKNLLVLLSLAVVTVGLSSCKMFSRPFASAGHTTTTTQEKVGTDTIRTETLIDSKSGLTEVNETKVDRYENVTKKERVPCPSCARMYWVSEGCCGSNTEEARKMSTAQGSSGSPHIGLIPTMKKIAP